MREINVVANLTCQIPATIHMGEIVMTLVTIHHSPMNIATRRGENMNNDTLVFKFPKNNRTNAFNNWNDMRIDLLNSYLLLQRNLISLLRILNTREHHHLGLQRPESSWASCLRKSSASLSLYICTRISILKGPCLKLQNVKGVNKQCTDFVFHLS